MKRKLLMVVYVVLIFITIKMLYNIITNHIVKSQYENGQYTEEPAKALTSFPFPESYVADYNYGNILYQNGQYEEAIKQYKQALEGIVPKEKECKIRINYALAICQTVQVDENDQISIQNAIETYESAIEILTQKGCANKNDQNGHSKDAQTLKEDIQDEIDRLKKLLNEEDSDNSEETIQDIKEQATQRQRALESQFKNYGDYGFLYEQPEKNW